MEAQLTFSEWIHDWWNGFRNKTGGEEVNLVIVEALYSYLKLSGYTVFAASVRAAPADETNRIISSKANELMTILYKGQNITVSSIEDTTIRAFEKSGHPLLSTQSPNARVSYAEIFTGSAGSRLSVAVIDSMIDFRNNYRTITLVPGEFTIKGLTPDQKTMLRTAIRIFFSGQRPDAAGLLPVKLLLTFDAAGKSVTKLFLNDPDAQALIMPSTIADSASTSLKKLGKEPNIFYFSDGRNIVPRNPFTRDIYHIVFRNIKFSELNPFDFSYEIYIKGDGAPTLLSSSTFSNTITQGPSLDTLMQNHINAYNKIEFRKSGSSGCLDTAKDIGDAYIQQIMNDVRAGKSIFQAQKQDGDEKQVKQAKEAAIALPGFIVAYVSQDKQSVLQADMEEEICSIKHYDDFITLRRNNIGMSAEVIAAYAAERDAKYVRDNEELFTKLVDGRMLAALAIFLRAGACGLRLSQPSVIRLLSKKSNDIRSFLEHIQTTLGRLNGEMSARITAFGTAGVAEKAAIIKGGFDQFESVSIPISALVEVGKISAPLDCTKSYPFLDYSPESYINLDAIMKAENASVSRQKTVRVPEDPVIILAAKDGYIEILNQIISGIKDTAISDELKADFTLPDLTANQAAVARYMTVSTTYDETESQAAKVLLKPGRDEALAAGQGATIAMRTALSAYFARINVMTGGAIVQAGGAIYDDPDRIEGLRQIAYDAGLFMHESILKGWPAIITANVGDNGVTTYTLNDPLPTIADIMSYMITTQSTGIDVISNKLSEDLQKCFIDYIGTDATLYNLMILLEPKICDGTGCRITDVHPVRQLPTLGYVNPGSREFISADKEAEANSKVSLWGIMVLAYLNEWFEGREEAKSIFGRLLGYPSKAYLDRFDLTIKRQWDALAGNLEAFFVGVVNGRIRPETINLVAGGARTTRRKRRHGRKTRRS